LTMTICDPELMAYKMSIGYKRVESDTVGWQFPRNVYG